MKQKIFCYLQNQKSLIHSFEAKTTQTVETMGITNKNLDEEKILFLFFNQSEVLVSF